MRFRYTILGITLGAQEITAENEEQVRQVLALAWPGKDVSDAMIECIEPLPRDDEIHEPLRSQLPKQDEGDQ